MKERGQKVQSGLPLISSAGSRVLAPSKPKVRLTQTSLHADRKAKRGRSHDLSYISSQNDIYYQNEMVTFPVAKSFILAGALGSTERGAVFWLSYDH